MILSLVLALLMVPQKAAIAVEGEPQLSPSAPWAAPFVAMPEAPELPKIDLNACPFEGCQFGEWTARKAVVVYSTWKPDRHQVTTLQKGQQVTAITGVNIILDPGRGIFDRDVPAFGASKGDVVYMYGDCGEGAIDMWVRGRYIKCGDPQFSWRPGFGCERNCDGHWLTLGKSEWWAQIRLADGTTGWVLVGDSFDGTDALA